MGRKMILRLSLEELDLMRSALEQYERSVRDQARTLIASDAAIEVCSRRLRVEALLSDLAQAKPHSPAASGNLIEMPVRGDNSEASPVRVA
jgi:hypothetical protein